MQVRPFEQPRPFVAGQAWAHLRQFTSARIALGRTGGSPLTSSVLDFRLAHARARDAVHAVFDVPEFVRQLEEAGCESFLLQSGASSRREYLVRPDRGRRLEAGSRAALAEASLQWGERDLAVIVSDGLSALAAQRHAAETAIGVQSLLAGLGWTFYPIFVVPFGRVKIQDEIGSMVRARNTLMLLGERPGLGAPDSLGAYFTHQPSAEKTDAERNCVSNIRPEGLPPAEAARKIAALLAKAAQLQQTGVGLKDEGEMLLPPESAPALPSAQ